MIVEPKDFTAANMTRLVHLYIEDYAVDPARHEYTREAYVARKLSRFVLGAPPRTDSTAQKVLSDFVAQGVLGLHVLDFFDFAIRCTD